MGPASPLGPSSGFPHAVKAIARPKTKGSKTIRMEFLMSWESPGRTEYHSPRPELGTMLALIYNFKKNKTR
jgi:hypothetical protein